MRLHYWIVAGLLTLSLASCGESAEEKAKREAEQRKADSTHKADSLAKLLAPRKAIYDVAVGMVKEKLKAPSTARFPAVTLTNTDSVQITERGKDTVWVIGHYDSQNAFGTYMHGRYKARLRKDSTGKWIPRWSGDAFLNLEMEYNPDYDYELKK